MSQAVRASTSSPYGQRCSAHGNQTLALGWRSSIPGIAQTHSNVSPRRSLEGASSLSFGCSAASPGLPQIGRPLFSGNDSLPESPPPHSFTDPLSPYSNGETSEAGPSSEGAPSPFQNEGSKLPSGWLGRFKAGEFSVLQHIFENPLTSATEFFKSINIAAIVTWFKACSLPDTTPAFKLAMTITTIQAIPLLRNLCTEVQELLFVGLCHIFDFLVVQGKTLWQKITDSLVPSIDDEEADEMIEYQAAVKEGIEMTKPFRDRLPECIRGPLNEKIPKIASFFGFDGTATEDTKLFAAAAALVAVIVQFTAYANPNKDFSQNLIQSAMVFRSMEQIQKSTKGVFDAAGTFLHKIFGFAPIDSEAQMHDALFKEMVRRREVLASWRSALRQRQWLLNQHRYIISNLQETTRKMIHEASRIQNANKHISNFGTALANLTNEYEKLCSQVSNIAISRPTKIEPTVLWIVGHSGVGKSAMINDIVKQLSDLEQRTLSVYTRCQTKHWDGYAGQQVVLWDDLGAIAENNDYAEFANIVTPSDTILPMANVAEKGCPFTARYIIVCSNNYDGDHSSQLVNPEILYRRRDILMRATDYKYETNGKNSHRKADYSHITFERLNPAPVDVNPNCYAQHQWSDEDPTYVYQPHKMQLKSLKTIVKHFHELGQAKLAKYHAVCAAQTKRALDAIDDIEEIDRLVQSPEKLHDHPVTTDIVLGDKRDPPADPQSGPMEREIQGHGTVVVCIGDPGIGKSDFARRALGAMDVPVGVDERLKEVILWDEAFKGTNAGDVYRVLNKFYETPSTRVLVLTANWGDWNSLPEDIKRSISRRSIMLQFEVKKGLWGLGSPVINLAESTLDPSRMLANTWIKAFHYDNLIHKKWAREDAASYIRTTSLTTNVRLVATTDVRLRLPNRAFHTINININIKELFDGEDKSPTEVIQLIRGSMSFLDARFFLQNSKVITEFLSLRYPSTSIEDVIKSINQKRIRGKLTGPFRLVARDETMCFINYDGDHVLAFLEGKRTLKRSGKKFFFVTEDGQKESVTPFTVSALVGIPEVALVVDDDDDAALAGGSECGDPEFTQEHRDQEIDYLKKLYYRIAMSWMAEIIPLVVALMPFQKKKKETMMLEGNKKGTRVSRHVAFSGDKLKPGYFYDEDDHCFYRGRDYEQDLKFTPTRWASDDDRIPDPPTFVDEEANVKKTVHHVSKSSHYEGNSKLTDDTTRDIGAETFQLLVDEVYQQESTGNGDGSDYTHSKKPPANRKYNVRFRKAKRSNAQYESKKPTTIRYKKKSELAKVITAKAEALQDSVSKDVMRLASDNSIYIAEGAYGLMIRDHIGVTVSHVFPDTHTTLAARKNGKYFFIRPLRFVEGIDVAVFEIVDKDVPRFRNITNHLQSCKSVRAMKDVACWLNLFEDGTMTTRVVVPISVHEKLSYDIKGSATTYDGLRYQSCVISLRSYAQFTEQGDCGAAAIINNTHYQKKILGLHCAASTSYGYIAPIYTEMFENLDKAAELQSGGPEVPQPTIDVVALEEQAIKFYQQPVQSHFSPHVNEVGRAVDVKKIGTCAFDELKPIRTKGSILTGIVESPLKLDIAKEEFDVAVLYEEDPRLSPGADFKKECFYKWNRPPVQPDQELLDACTRYLAERYIKVMKKHFVEIRRLTTLEAVNRWTSMHESNPMAMNSSAGYPLNKVKGAHHKKHIFELKDDGIYHFKDNQNAEDVISIVNTIETEARNGRVTASVFEVAAKDEVRKVEKIKEGKTRSFAMCPLPLAIAHRKNFHGVMCAMAHVRAEIGPKVGMNPYSREAEELYRYMSEVGVYGYDLDFKAWDATTPQALFKCVPEVYNKIYQELDVSYHPDHDKIRTGIYNSIHQPFYLIDGVVYQAFTGQPSGEPGTAPDNSVMNELMMIYNYIKIARKYCPTEASFSAYERNVRFASYGDDCMLSMSALTTEWLTYERIAEVVSSDFGMTVTPGDKTTDTRMKPVRDMTFLQRNFRWDEVGKMWVMPLNYASIKKMSSFTKASKRYQRGKDDPPPPDWHSIEETARAMALEAAYHGKDFYNKVINHIKSVLDSSQWPTFDERYQVIQSFIPEYPARN